jgi:hypothetical protein
MPEEQIKNIIDNNSHETQWSERHSRQVPQKTARERLL